MFMMDVQVASILLLVAIDVYSMDLSNSATAWTGSSTECPEGFVFEKCTNICPPPSCGTLHLPRICFSLRCGPPKCVCKQGLIRKSLLVEECVDPNSC
uniref:TIL domain-containing protein n=2 Tax=Parascaris univalens TaxID=6257 RepID=A0A914ZG59_PARUN